jgi:ubiquinone/menaquinone biosynthesis C-methylase UbiE
MACFVERAMDETGMVPVDETARQLARYERRARRYDRGMWLIDALAASARRRARLFAGCAGRLLEVGVGTGGNFRHYPPAVEAFAIDLAPAMLELAARRAERMRLAVSLRAMDVCALAFPDASFDRIVASCVFCSVPDPVAGLRELRRVLRPGGEIRLIEHMRPAWRPLGRLFDLLDAPLYRWLGFHIARRTLENVAAAGLEARRDESWLGEVFHYLELVPRPGAP